MRCLQDPDAESGAGVQIEPSVTPSIGYGAAVVNVKGFAQANSGKAMDEVLVVPAQATHFVQYLNQPLHGARGRAGLRIAAPSSADSPRAPGASLARVLWLREFSFSASLDPCP